MKRLILATLLFLVPALASAELWDRDKLTLAQNMIDYPHHEIHDGSYFQAFNSGTAKNDGTTTTVYFKTPTTATTKQPHVLMRWSASGAAWARIREAPTVTANTGTNGVAPVNHNRNSAKTSVVLDNATTPVADRYARDVTVTAGGTVIWEDYSGVGRSSSGSGRAEEEFVLKADTAYVFEVESDAAGLTLALSVGWYEHTPKLPLE